jgi:hypothetical protein
MHPFITAISLLQETDAVFITVGAEEWTDALEMKKSYMWLDRYKTDL